MRHHSGLRASAIATGMETVYALTKDGTVRAWGANGFGELDLPDPVRQANNVKAIAAFSCGAIALLADNTLVRWGGSYRPPNELHAWLSDLGPLSIAGNNDFLAMADDEGALHHWYAGGLGELPVPTELNGHALAQLVVGADGGTGAVVITKRLRGDDPQISGTPTVGSTLTAMPGTFSASPEAVTSQWLADGAVIADATGATLPLTVELLGKKIAYRSTATKAGETTISSASAAVAVTNRAEPPAPPAPPAAPTVVGSTTKVVKVWVAKDASSVTVTGKVAAVKPVTGTASVTIKRGKKTIVVKSVVVAPKGAVTLTVKKFRKLAIKKSKATKKNGYRGSYTVAIAYSGNSQVNASTASRAFRVR